MAQRLVRKICEKCRSPTRPDERELRLLGIRCGRASSLSCSGRGLRRVRLLTGYRAAWAFSRSFRHRGIAAADLRAGLLRRFARKRREMGMRTLREDGMRKVVAGMTTLEEVFRVTMGDNE
jgi:type IV pilus assembly protein PilB